MADILNPTTDAINVLADNMKTLVKKIQDLRHIGIEDSSIALPKICVIGDQSTGKSSLIEGMSEIKVPRAAGTCTRCPMEINLSESDQPWACRVFLSRRYFYDNAHKQNKTVKKSKPLGPWIEMDPEDEPFITLSNKDSIDEAIKWAQLAILNPNRSSADYIPGQNTETSSHCYVKFSPNVVRLDISAPNFPNLSFYDLPGVISQAEHDEERYLVALVENLVKEYISQDNCIVLLALPMTDDATNSSAARIMRDVPGAKQRTLGVLTKPDRIQTGESIKQWEEILEGDKFALGHGYYIVRNNPDPSISHALARHEEAAFFATPPWNTMVSYRNRFGTRQLQGALSNLLLDQIQGCLPRIIEQIDKKAARIETELKTLPDPPSANVQYILCRSLHHLQASIRAHFDGGSAEYPLQKIWGHMASDFNRALVKTRPTVQMLTDSDLSTYIKNDNGDSDCEMTSVSPARPVKRKTPGATPAPVPPVPVPPVPVPPETRRTPMPTSPGYYTHHFDNFTRAARMFTWKEIREINEDSYRAGIPDQADPKAIEIMRQLSVKHWDQPMVAFLEATHTLVREMLFKQLKDVFKDYYQTSLYRELRKTVDEYLSILKKEHFRYADEIYQIEHNKPFTMATDALEQARNKAYEFIADRRHKARVKLYLDVQGIQESRRESEAKKLTSVDLGIDKYAQELKMMASTRGYYDVAKSRFVDSICQSVYTKLFSKCREGLISQIEEKLGIADENALERCQELMAEDSERQNRRQYLLREKDKVNRAQQWLSTIKKEDDNALFVPDVRSRLSEDWRSSLELRGNINTMY
ncbi:hypothetical protein FE257_008455 [Aspergillus nanangensis]|uniref:Dynamin family protein n=1 Tax=Aspergillus nanangensis TaxID=2582783 RepID=A0AAD4CLT8_ASPNN|nr:hypothetical protein FE257_008455 [Aspergillus nanangensis]